MLSEFVGQVALLIFFIVLAGFLPRADCDQRACHCSDNSRTAPFYFRELFRRSHHTMATPFNFFGINSEITPRHCHAKTFPVAKCVYFQVGAQRLLQQV